MENSAPHSLNTAFQKSDAAKPTALENLFERMRNEVEEKIANFQMAADVCSDMGYNVNDITVQMLQQAIDDVSRDNGYKFGDDWKPFDPDMAYADEAGLRTWFGRELPRKGIKIPPKPEQSELAL